MDLPNASDQQLLLAAPNNHHNTFLKDSHPAATPLTQHLQQSPPNHAANPHLVYVRRKSEGETPKNTAFDNTRQLYCEEEIPQPKPHIKDPKVSSFPAFAPFPIASSITASAKPSVPVSLGNSSIISVPVSLGNSSISNHVAPSSGHTIVNPKVFTNVHWEERYQQLQMFLRKLDQSNQADYIQMLQSLSSIELSRHAVELEKRSIQLSLEEAKELQRVAALNVLGKPVKNFKARADHVECSDKLKTST
ncbi:unnamed protein product [Lathyrus sativus]|nr:unnamed protein product [Lathyrus sativus]